jgi:hypothetical protein
VIIFQDLCMSIRVLAVILLLACCLVSAVSAMYAPGCPAFGPVYRGGIGVKSDYWGMSADEIAKYAAANPKIETDSSSWTPPPLVLPTSQTDKFASLNTYRSTSKETLPITSLSIDITPSFGGLGKKDTGTDAYGKKSLFL